MLYPAPQRLGLAAIHSLRSFDSKINMADQVAGKALSPTLLENWRRLHSRIKNLQVYRNRLAHWAIMPLTDFDGEGEVLLMPPAWSPDHLSAVIAKEALAQSKRPMTLKEMQSRNEQMAATVGELFSFLAAQRAARPTVAKVVAASEEPPSRHSR
jgi:hypothetical protein